MLLHRKPRKKNSTGYPGLRDAGNSRSRLASLVGRSVMGAVLVGSLGCSEGERIPVSDDVKVEIGELPWVSMGVAPREDMHNGWPGDVKPDNSEGDPDGGRTDKEDLGLRFAGDLPYPDYTTQPETTQPEPDALEDLWVTMGVPPLPDDLVEQPEDVQGEEMPPLAGDMPLPDVLEDASGDDIDGPEFKEDFFIGGMPPMPEEYRKK